MVVQLQVVRGTQGGELVTGDELLIQVLRTDGELVTGVDFVLYGRHTIVTDGTLWLQVVRCLQGVRRLQVVHRCMYRGSSAHDKHALP